MINAKDAKRRSARVVSGKEQREYEANVKAENAAEAWAKKVLPTYVKELEKEIRAAIRDGCCSANIRLPGYEDDKGTRSLAWRLSDKMKEHGYSTSWDYYRTHDIDYPDDHWSFEVSW